MASTHLPARRRFLTGRRVLVTLVVAAGGATLSPMAAQAAPDQPTTSAEAQALVDAKGHDLEVVTEKFNDAREQLSAKQQAATDAAAQVETAEAAVSDARAKVREVARSAYTTDQLGSLQAMLTSRSADELMDRMGTLDSIAARNNGILDEAKSADAKADAAKAAADDAADEAEKLVDQVADQQKDLQTQIAAFQAQRDRLAGEEADRAEREAAQAAQASAAAAAPATTGGSTATAAAPAAKAASGSAPAGSVSASSGAAQTAVDTALAQLGKPYVWAAAGPGSFDCSGLVQYAYAAAGISLPHSSGGQASMGRAVSRADLQPGDIIAFYSPVSHVGIYIGNGQMVHAPTSGDVVKVASIDVMGSITAMRRIAG